MDPEDEEIDALPEEDDDQEEGEGTAEDDGAEGEGLEAGGQETAQRQNEREVESERKPSRANSRIRTLADELRAERERGAQRDRELAELRAAQGQRQQPRETREEREARLALMSPEERSEYRLNEALELNNRRMAEMQFSMQDTADRSAFQARAATDKLVAKYAPQVESELAKLRSQGQNVGREQLFTYLVGQAALAARGKSTEKAQKDGQTRIRRQTTRPLNGKGDTASARGRTSDSLERRLENIDI